MCVCGGDRPEDEPLGVNGIKRKHLTVYRKHFTGIICVCFRKRLVVQFEHLTDMDDTSCTRVTIA